MNVPSAASMRARSRGSVVRALAPVSSACAGSPSIPAIRAACSRVIADSVHTARGNSDRNASDGAGTRGLTIRLRTTSRSIDPQ